MPLYNFKKHNFPCDADSIKAVILDVDGTLYRQGPVRRAMVWRLLRVHARCPGKGINIVRVLWAYRRAQEALRTSSRNFGDLADKQLQLACEWTRVAPDVVRSCVARWMYEEPLGVVASSLRGGLLEFLRALKERGLGIAALSDYPCTAKLKAMRVEQFFDVVVSAQDLGVGSFKPNPRGLLLLLRRLQVRRHEALYIGDRPEVDAAVARSAGVSCVIVGQRSTLCDRGWLGVSDYRELKDVLWSHFGA